MADLDQRADTFPKLLVRKAAELGAKTALREKEFGIWQDSTLSEVAYVIDHSEAVFVVAEDQEQVDKILDLSEKLPRVRNVIYTDPRGMWNYKHPSLISFTAVEDRGREL